MEIQPYQIGDFEELLAMALTLWPDYSQGELEEELKGIIDSPKEIFFLSKQESQVTGFIQVSIRSDYVPGAQSSPVAYVEGLFVKAGFRKKGIARQLIQIGEEWAREKGCTEMGSDTWDWNTDSKKFPLAVGFLEEDTLVHFIKDIEK